MSSNALASASLVALLVTGLLPAQAKTPAAQSQKEFAMLAPWQGPYGGVPAWSKVQPADFPAAFAVAMQAQREAIRHISENPKPATFANTILDRKSVV